jgi:hypothetical protein
MSQAQERKQILQKKYPRRQRFELWNSRLKSSVRINSTTLLPKISLIVSFYNCNFLPKIFRISLFKNELK